ncbi:amidohydrolase family protein [Acrocarpospora macrocephala]|uniref:Organophopsphate acid anhydrase n=1 Tax=Acrocarpospora macrocephala TaxID=150177 RepID=A0A5M3WWG1_9ACTN|nr:amidohydrolase family protein [Acrocarpospora macrocephala]GES10498.1 organophopsphate acid anhydrase [Acrocarpospora macrocephala]
MTAQATRTAFVGATLIDGTGALPVADTAVVVGDGRITWVGARADLEHAPDLRIVDTGGKYMIPGLLDANVHLLIHVDPDVLLRYAPGCYDELVLEAAQIALRAGVTTVFDTWGPLESLRRVRDRINAGQAIGSRVFCAGNIIGNGGPYSADFFPNLGAGLSSSVVEAINRHWEQGVGAALTWMPAADVRVAVREYIATSDIDFVKYASSSHAHSRFLALSPDSQRAIVEEAHAAGMTVQACTQSPEALKAAIDAGVDLLQHGDVTGLHPMPEETLDRIVERRLPCVAFLYTQRHTTAFLERKPQWHGNDAWGEVMMVKDLNDRKLVKAGAMLLLGNDMGVYGPTAETSPMWGPFQSGIPDVPTHLGRSHIFWLRAAIERDMAPMDALLATTSNIAQAYGRLDELGTVEPGKRADLLILDADPLADPDNYARIAHVVKDGELVDRDRLPEHPVLTR